MKDPFSIQFAEWMVVSERIEERGKHDSMWIGQFITEVDLNIVIYQQFHNV